MLAASALLLAAGCGGGSHKPAIRTVPPRAGVGGRLGLARAGCTTATATARPLNTHAAFLGLSDAPFGVSITPDGRFAFVDEIGGRLAVLAVHGSTPRLLRTITVPGDSLGDSLTPDGRYLLVANGVAGATVVDVQRAETGSADAVLGTLIHGAGATGPGGAIEVASSADSHFVFVSLEDSGTEAVYNLQAAAAAHFRTSGYVGSVPVGIAPVGLALSPDGRWLYATSEAGNPGTATGTLSVINIATAEHDPAHAVVATVPARCSPVRVAVSADGKTVWVTARGSDELLAFSAAKLRGDPAHALLASVRVGEAPVGLALVNDGHDVVVADSNRFGAPGARAQLTVVSATAALAHRPALLGTIPAGAFPREMALEPDRSTLLVGNFGSDQLEAVTVGNLP